VLDTGDCLADSRSLQFALDEGAGLASLLSMKYLATLALLFAALFLLSCGLLPDNAPKLIDADGSAYVACEGLVWVSTQEGVA
jgi:hypothetical protein